MNEFETHDQILIERPNSIEKESRYHDVFLHFDQTR